MSPVGYATLSVIPSMKGFGSKLSDGIGPEMDAAGRDGGKRFGGGLASAATSIGGKAGKVLGVGILGGLGVAMAGLGAVLHTGFGEAMDASAGTAQLAAGIKSTGNAAGVSVKNLNALASSIQGYSGQTDDSIVASEKLLLTFTNIKNKGPSKIFDLATVASADMAAKMGGSASDSAIQLGKALNDPIKGVGALSRVGVSFTAAQKDSIAAMVKHGDTAGAQKIILKELAVEFGGAAKAAGTSLPGQLAKSKRAFEDVSQAIMEGALPVLVPMFTKIAGFVTGTLMPGMQVFFSFLNGNDTGVDGPFREMAVAGTVLRGVLVSVVSFITGTAVPAIKGFVTEFSNGAGAGGTFRNILERVGTVIAATAASGLALAVFLRDHNGLVVTAAVVVGVLTAAVQAHNVAMFISSGQLKAWILQTTIVKTATAVWAAGQWLLNAALTANPIGIVVVAVAALVAGIVLIATKTTWFQTVWQYMTSSLAAAWQWLWNTILAPIIRFVLNGFASITDGIANMLKVLSNIPGFGWAKDAADKMSGAADKARALASGIKDIKSPPPIAIRFTSNLGEIGRQIGATIGAANKLASMGVGHNAMGTSNWRGGPTWVGERGPEIVNLPSGSQVIPNNRIGGGADRQPINLMIDKQVFARIVVDVNNADLRRNGVSAIK